MDAALYGVRGRCDAGSVVRRGQFAAAHGGRMHGPGDQRFEAAGLEDFELFWDNKPVNGLQKFGLLRL